MRRLLHIAAVACLAGSLAVVLAWRYGETLLSFAVTSATPDPQDGKVAGVTYTNAYFDLTYPLPQGFAEGLAGADPSYSGYYVLGNFVLWLFVSVLSTIVFFLMGVPYWALAGPLSGFCSLTSNSVPAGISFAFCERPAVPVGDVGHGSV